MKFPIRYTVYPCLRKHKLILFCRGQAKPPFPTALQEVGDAYLVFSIFVGSDTATTIVFKAENILM